MAAADLPRRRIDAQTVARLLRCINAARSRDWSDADLHRWFRAQGIPQRRFDRLACDDDIRGEIADVFEAIACYGLPETSAVNAPGFTPGADADTYADIPAAMKTAKRWLLCKLIPEPGKKPRKMPFYADGRGRTGRLDTPEDQEGMATFDAALASFIKADGTYAYLGFALGPDGTVGADGTTPNHWQGIDLDQIAEHPGLRFVADALPGYVEISLSGQGMHAMGYGRPSPTLGKRNGCGIEAYSHGRFFAVTGRSAGLGEPVCIAEFIETVLAPLHAQAGGRTADDAAGRTAGAGERVGILRATLMEPDLRDALRHIPADDRDLWVKLGYALKGLSEIGKSLWLEWSGKSAKFTEPEALKTWEGLDPHSATYRSVFHVAKQYGWSPPYAANDDDGPHWWDEGGEQDDPPNGDTDGFGAGTRADGQGGGAWGDPERAMLGDGLAPPPPLPLVAFGRWSPWLADFAATVSAPVDYAAAGLLSLAASAVGTARRVSPWGGWEEYPALWCLNVGPPSASKSPIYGPLIAILQGLERDEGAGFDFKRRQWETDKLYAKMAREKWERDTETQAKDARWPVGVAKPTAADDPEEPKPPRLLVSDATIESLTPLFKSNPRGLLLARDELAGWIGNFGKYGGDGDAAYFLERWTGAPATVDRVKNGTIHADPALLSVFGGIQPERMSELMLARPDDGLVSRFCYFYPGPVRRRRPTKVVDKNLLADALRRLRALPFDKDPEGREVPLVVRLTDEAAQVFEAWWEATGKEASDALGLQQGTLGKGPGIVLRTALLLELLDWAIKPLPPEPTAVGEEAVARAVAVFDGYWAKMALRVFGWTGLPVGERNATALLRAIRKSGQRQVNARELRRDRVAGLTTSEAVTDALERLAAGGWVRYSGHRAGSSSGRQRMDWDVNPALWEGR